MAEQFVLVKHAELHGKNSDVEPTAVPVSAFNDLWSEKGFVLVNAHGDEVKDEADAYPERQDQVLAAKRSASRTSKPTSRPDATVPSSSSKEG